MASNRDLLGNVMRQMSLILEAEDNTNDALQLKNRAAFLRMRPDSVSDAALVNLRQNLAALAAAYQGLADHAASALESAMEMNK